MCLKVINRSNCCAKTLDAVFFHVQNSSILNLYFLSTLNQILLMGENGRLRQMRKLDTHLPATSQPSRLPAGWLAQGSILQTSHKVQSNDCSELSCSACKQKWLQYCWLQHENFRAERSRYLCMCWGTGGQRLPPQFSWTRQVDKGRCRLCDILLLLYPICLAFLQNCKPLFLNLIVFLKVTDQEILITIAI